MRKGTKKMTISQRKSLDGFLFVLPWLLGCSLLFLYPVVNSLMLSMGELKSGGSLAVKFVGIINYKKAFVEDVNFIPNFLASVRSTLINLPLIIVFSLFIAILINRKMAFRGFFREVFFFPVLLGTGFIMQQLLQLRLDVEAMAMARQILMPDDVLIYLGPRVSQAVGVFFNTIVVVLWKSGVQIVLFLAGLQSIPGSLNEAAYMDGATEWEKFWEITLPLMAPTILLNIVYTMVDSFTDAANPVLQYIMIMMLRLADFDYAAAIGWIYFTFIFVLVLVIFGIMKPFTDNVKSR